MSTEQDLDRSLAATPYKLEKAREKGRVAKSPEVVSAAVFLAAMVYLLWQGWVACRAQFRVDQAVLIQAGQWDVTAEAIWPLLQHLIRTTMFQLAPFFGLLMLTGALANVLQTGPVFSFHPIKPDWDRVNPASGFKRIFTFRTLVMGLRALLKLALLGLMVYFALKSMLPQFFHISTLSPRGLTNALLDDFAALGLKIGMMLGFIALLDWVYTRYEFTKQMRMSHREMKDEHKHREGDPRIRARLRELRREMLKRSLSLRRTKEADVVITNPTHVAVALRYTHGQMASPQVIAKGKGFMAAAMRKIAAKHQIPVVQNPSLARKLYKELPIDIHVPTEMYAQVARIIVWVFARRDAQRNGTAQAPKPSVTRLGNAWNP